MYFCSAFILIFITTATRKNHNSVCKAFFKLKNKFEDDLLSLYIKSNTEEYLGAKAYAKEMLETFSVNIVAKFIVYYELVGLDNTFKELISELSLSS